MDSWRLQRYEQSNQQGGTFNSIEWILVFRLALRLAEVFYGLSIPLNGFTLDIMVVLNHRVKVPFNSIEWIHFWLRAVVQLRPSFNSIEWIQGEGEGNG